MSHLTPRQIAEKDWDAHGSQFAIYLERLRKISGGGNAYKDLVSAIADIMEAGCDDQVLDDAVSRVLGEDFDIYSDSTLDPYEQRSTILLVYRRVSLELANRLRIEKAGMSEKVREDVQHATQS